MAEPKVWTFFYGSYMNRAVLAEVGIFPERFDVARLCGYDLRIEPRANLDRSDERCVYGVVTTVTHPELARLYAHAKDVLGEAYLPEAVLVQTSNGEWRPALCYISHSMQARAAADDYIDRIVVTAREFGFPEWYIQRIEHFRKR